MTNKDRQLSNSRNKKLCDDTIKGTYNKNNVKPTYEITNLFN